jgi:hypothetical protein
LIVNTFPGPWNDMRKQPTPNKPEPVYA